MNKYKKLLIFIMSSLFFNFSAAMDLSEIEINWLPKEKIEIIQKEYEKGIKLKLEELNAQNTGEILKEYILDCYKIDYAIELLQDYESSTQGINSAYFYGYQQYDRLLNKYYSLYKNRLNEKNKAAFLEEQKAWIKLRDAYEQYILAHKTLVYTSNGGGTIYSNFVSVSRFDFLKKRVDELYKYYSQAIDNSEIQW
ncbi:lysozyme inhibitor LprI family protein [Campylobacter insulaenigrae]|uniref:lysozyme inhibitor LprI family protein n=1 Tax=Campylobacter insulaenigrae TaxID=260714 RepID=UPI00242A7FAF|nr:DUF1311 domain-containing protein [Campylobacter insulaenigrae]